MKAIEKESIEKESSFNINGVIEEIVSYKVPS
jgi:hypothetical protein